jgi:hypothetical protein
LQAIAVLSFLANNIEHRIDEFGAFSVMALCPVVSGTGLTENEVIRPENLSVRSRSNAVHGSRFKIHENGAWNEPSTTSLVVVDIDPLKLKIGVAAVPAGGVDAVLGADHFPELGTNLVAALATLDVKDLTHFEEALKVFEEMPQKEEEGENEF